MSAGGQLKKNIKKVQEGLTNAGQRETALDRIAKLEQRFGQLGSQLRHTFGSFGEKVDSLTRVMNALVELVGQKEVEAKVTATRVKELEDESDATAASVEGAVTAGELVATEVIDLPEAFVVTQEHGKDGQLMHPSRLHLPLDGYKPEIKALLEGKRVGEVIDLPEGGKITVLAVYRPGTPAPAAAPPGETEQPTDESN